MVEGFSHLNINSTTIGISLGLLALFGLWWFFLRSKKAEKSKQGIVAEQEQTQVIKDEKFHLETPEQHYCKCGLFFGSGQKLHMHIVGKRKEPDKHGTGEVKPKIIINSKQKYRVLVNCHSAFGIEPKRVFSRINIPLGRAFWADTSLPESGDTFWVEELANGSIAACDPLKDKPIDSKKNPTRAYKATHCSMAEGFWVFEISWKDLISDIMVIILVIVTGLLGLVALGG